VLRNGTALHKVGFLRKSGRRRTAMTLYP